MFAEPSNKAIEDFYQGEDKKAIQDTTYDDLSARYPMMCYCRPEGPVKPCRIRPDGHRGRIPLGRKWLWACPSFGWFALKYMKVGYMKKFYTDDYPQASLGIIAFSSVLSVLIDAFTDPRMATWTDNVKSKYGRRRPFVFFSAFFTPFVFLMGWMPALVSPGIAASIWFGVWHIMFKLADIVYMIPYNAWGAQLTPIYKEKTNVWQWKELFANVGILFGMAVMPLLFVTDQCYSTPDDGCWELPLLSAAFGAIFAVSALGLVRFGKDPSTAAVVAATVASSESDSEEAAVAAEQSKPSGFSEHDPVLMLISTFLNKPFRVLLVTGAAKALGQDIPFNVLPFLTSWVIGEKFFSASTFFGVLVLANLVSGLVAVPLWTRFAACTSKYRAYVCFNAALVITTLSFLVIGYDDGSGTMSYLGLALTAIFGAAYGGAFILSDLVSDVVDYDEFITGGRRREASYLMAVEFIPKFVNIPGECLPFLMMAYYNYKRPLPSADRPSCGAEFQPAGGVFTPDAFCAAYYSNGTAATKLCGNKACAELVANGVSFVCNDALGECGIQQPAAVRSVLIVCFSIVPCLCVLAGTLGLYFYPRHARSEAMQQKLVACITKVRRGETVEDPWRPGNMVKAQAPPGPSAGTLAYFWPAELKKLAELSCPGQPVNMRVLLPRPVAFTVLHMVLVIPLGLLIVALGMADLQDDLGASVSPIGLMLVGIGVLGAWFDGIRVRAAASLLGKEVLRSEVVAQYNRYCPFTGSPALPEDSSEPASGNSSSWS